MENNEEITFDSQNGELVHWGIKGQKWGIRRFQNPDGSLTPEGQKRYNAKVAKLESKQTKLRNKQEAKARKSKIKSLKDDIAARKKALKKGEDYIDKNEPEHIKSKKRTKLLNSNDPAEIYKNRHLLTTSELKDRIDRINTEQNLKSAADKNAPKKKTAFDRVDSVVKWGNKANDVYKLTETSLGKKILESMGFGKEETATPKWTQDTKRWAEEYLSELTGKKIDVTNNKNDVETVSKLMAILNSKDKK